MDFQMKPRSLNGWARHQNGINLKIDLSNDKCRIKPTFYSWHFFFSISLWRRTKIDDFPSEILLVFASFPMILSRNADSQQYILTILIADNNSSIAVNEVFMLYFENVSRMVRFDINTTNNLSLCIYYQLLLRYLLVKIPGILP